MKKLHNQHQTAISYRPFISFITILIIILLAGCQESVRKNSPPAVSLEEAKKITATFVGQAFTPPPRTINDITAILSQEKPDDLKAYQQALALADSQPPDTNDDLKLANFYLKRANAAFELGHAKQEIEDYRLAVEHGSKRSFRYQRGATWALGTAELRGGNWSQGMQILERLISKEDRPVAKSIFSAVIARIYAGMGDLAAAQEALKQAERNRQEAWDLKQLPVFYLTKIDSYINVARGAILSSMGRLAEGEPYFRQAIAEHESIKNEKSASGLSQKRWLVAHNWVVANLAKNLMRQGRLTEAEVQARRAVHGAIEIQGLYAAPTCGKIAVLNIVILEQGRYSEAEALARANFDILSRIGMAADSAFLARARSLLADTILTQRRWREALVEYDLIREALKTDLEAYNKFIGKKANLWIALIKGGRGSEALSLIQPVFEHRKKLFGEKHFSTVKTRALLAMALASTGQREQALAEFAKSAPILLERARASEGAHTTQTAREFRLGLILDAYIQLLSDIRGTSLEAKLGIDAISEAFSLADFVRGRTVTRALVASNVRAASRTPGLADLARREQDALTQIGALNGLLSKVLSAPSDQQNPEVIQDLRSRIGRLRSARAALTQEIEVQFPDYADLINPKPANVAETRSSLKPGETLVATFVSEDHSYVWAIPHTGPVSFTSTELGTKAITQTVKALRETLDPQAVTLGGIPAFDLQKAYRLYAALLKPLEKSWKDSSHLIMVPHGALGYLPFAVLPTKPVILGPETKPLFSNYRTIPWLARTHSVTVLPSVASLRSLRSLPVTDLDRRPFVGFGDPYFNLSQASQGKTKTEIAAAGPTRGLPLKRRAIHVTAHLDSARIGILPRLPDTADEVREIAIALNADLKHDIFLGKAASEGQVKSMDLSGIKVLVFATHGLLPGDLDGLTQPALALTAPEVAGGTDDGLLTMGEILGLRLNADWVVLSACNTGAGKGAGSEAVSGLGRAFFYAGSRALLVSNWPVETTSAKTLTTEIFRRQAADPTLRRAEALNRTMLDLIDKSGFIDAEGRMVFSYAHPVFWAPFSLVGDGG